MTVLDSRPEPAEAQLARSEQNSEVLITESGVSMVSVPDIGYGRGPNWLDDWMTANLTDLLAWRRHIHANPELSIQEFQTTDFLAGVLRSVGLRPEVLSNGTGLLCEVGTGTHCVALRADIDALPLNETTGLPYASTVPNVSHACGHDAHTAILLGAALALASAPELPGRVRLIFQPAEELMSERGAQEVIEAGGLDGVDRIFGLHCYPHLPVGKVGTRVGALTSAADMIELRLTSPGGHTSRPHLSADLVYAIGTVITGLPGLLSRRVDPRSGTVFTWGAVHAGEAANAIPESGVLRGTLRTGDHNVWNTIEPLIKEIVHSLLSPTNVDFELNHIRGVPVLVNELESTRILEAGVEAALGKVGLATVPQSTGGEDFAWYLEQIPGSFARLGVWSGHGKQYDLHQPGFILDERAIPVGVRVMVHAALAALS